jgi:hypothetical protein
VADRLQPDLGRGAAPLTAEGLCDWWEDSVKTPDRVSKDQESQQRAQER